MAVVLGGGGVAGIAWQTGLLHGLADSGVDVTSPDWSDMLLGTSAGSTVAAQVTSGVSLGDLYARQVDPMLQIEEPRPDVSIDELTALFGSAFEQAAGDAQKLARYIGQAAIAAATVPESERRAVIARRLPSHEWPDRDLRIVAVDAESGRHRVLDRTSGVRLVDAVAASCAIPGMWPPVTIGNHRYVDGGVRSAENADLAIGFAKVLVLQVVGALNDGENPLEVEREHLTARGAFVEIVRPDDDAAEAIGPDPTNPAVRTAASEAGYRQGRRIADAVEKFKLG
jgi:NTE family protein